MHKFISSPLYWMKWQPLFLPTTSGPPAVWPASTIRSPMNLVEPQSPLLLPAIPAIFKKNNGSTRILTEPLWERGKRERGHLYYLSPDRVLAEENPCTSFPKPVS